MGFYVRKSLRAGPFRFNISKSGLGVSAGIPGFRIGSGPRGNYVHAGRGGIYYRATLGGRNRQLRPRAVSPSAPRPTFTPSDGIAMTDVTGASADELYPTGPGDLVAQLNEAAARHRIAPWVAVVVVALLFVKPVVGVILLLPGVVATAWLWLRDRARRSVVAFYDVNDDVAAWFERLVGAFEGLERCSRLWRVNAAGRVETTYQFKVNSGASKIVSRVSATVRFDPPSALKTNIKVPTIVAGRESLSFLPDRVLVRSGARYSDARYSDFETAAYAQRFIEDGGVPRDAEQVDTTWQYVNVKGGPDRRYKNNRQLPVLLYGQLELASRAGLFWIFQMSQPDAGEPVAEAILAAPGALENVQEAAAAEAAALPAG